MLQTPRNVKQYHEHQMKVREAAVRKQKVTQVAVGMVAVRAVMGPHRQQPRRERVRHRQKRKHLSPAKGKLLRRTHLPPQTLMKIPTGVQKELKDYQFVGFRLITKAVSVMVFLWWIVAPERK